MEELVDVDPLRLRIGLNLMTDDGGPHGAVDQQSLGTAVDDLLTRLLEARTELTPARVGLGTEERMGNPWNNETLDDHVASGNQPMTALPVPMTVP